MCFKLKTLDERICDLDFYRNVLILHAHFGFCHKGQLNECLNEMFINVQEQQLCINCVMEAYGSAVRVLNS